MAYDKKTENFLDIKKKKSKCANLFENMIPLVKKQMFQKFNKNNKRVTSLFDKDCKVGFS